MRRFRRWCWKSLIFFIIASAVIVSIGRLLAPQADAFRPLIEQFLSNRLGQSVQIDQVEASWPRLSPRISIRGLQIGSGEARLFNVDRARLEFKLYNLVRPRRNSFELVVLGLDMSLLQDAQGRWSWRLDRGATLPRGWERALSAGDLLVRDSSVEVVPRDLPSVEWKVPEARLNRFAQRVGIRLRANASGGPEAAVDVRVLLDLDDAGLEGVRGYASVLEPARIPVGDEHEPELRIAPDARAWLEWTRGEGGRVHARLTGEIAPPTRDATVVTSADLALDLQWGAQRGLRAEIDAWVDDEGGRQPVVGLGLALDGPHFGLAAERLDLQFVQLLVAPWVASFAAWPEQLAGIASSLEIGGTRGQGFHRVGGRIEDLLLEWDRPGIGFSGLTLDLTLDGDAPVLTTSGSVELRLPALYPEPIALSRIAGSARVRDDLLVIDALELEHEDVSARVDGGLHWIDESPYLDLVIDTPRLSSRTPRRWLPLRGLPPKTRNWLDQALLEVGGAGAVTTLHGRPLEWPRHVPDAAVSSEIEVSGLRLAYAPGWPIAEQVRGRVEFTGESMWARAASGRVADVALRAPEVRIDDTRNAEIELSLESAAGVTAEDLSRLALALPLDAAETVLSRMSWSGEAGARARVWLPVRRRDEWRMIGSIDFSGADLSWPTQGRRLEAISGELPFTRDGLGPALLDAELLDDAVAISFEGRWAPRFRMSMRGRFPARGLIPETWRMADPALFERLSGAAGFEFDFLRPDDRDEGPVWMHVTSDLVGVGSTLPEPLAKDPASAMALALQVPLQAETAEPVEFSLAEVVTGSWLQTGPYWQLGLGFGGESVGLPVAENFRIEGDLPALALDAWAALLGQGAVAAMTVDEESGDRVSGWLDVSVGDLRLGSGSLGALDMVLNREREYWRLNVDGEQARGSVRLPATPVAERSLVADFDRLYWPESDAGQGDDERAPSMLDPRSVPALNLAVDDLRLGALRLGEFRLNSHQSVDGLEIEQVSSRREGLEWNGSGEWTQTGPAPVTQMRLRLSTADLGEALTDAGFDIALNNGRAVIGLDGAWPGTPLDLSLARLEGRINLVISDGVIPEASPGAGRLLGLVSLNSIPRRLRLDFSDVFGEGLSFDRVEGDFSLSGGVARTDNLRIDAPAAEIRMRGRTDLAGRSYDQTLIVRPGVSSALPVIGALAGGPVGAAAGAALQQIFSRPLSGISEVRYSVTGSWDDPVIEPISVSAAERREDG